MDDPVVANPPLVRRSTSASGVEVVVVAEPDDLYFQGRLAATDNFEPAVSVARLTLPDDGVALDLGACLGIVSAALGELAPRGHVYAVEANPSLLPGLTETCLATTNRNVHVVSSAIGAEPGHVDYHADPTGSAWGYVAEGGGQRVEQTTIDDLVAARNLTRVDFVKIDIEGHELYALRGAERTIADHHPVLVVEMNAFCLWRYGRTLPQDLVAWMRDRYDHLWSIDDDAGVTELTSDAAVDAVLARVGTTGRLVDLVAANDHIDFPQLLWTPTTPEPREPGEPQRSAVERLVGRLRR